MEHEPLSPARRHGDYAGFVTRMVAFFLDRFIVIALVVGTVLFVELLLRTYQLGQVLGINSLSLNWRALLGGGAVAVFSLVYDVGFWTLAGQTPGKQLMGLLVVRANGDRLKLGAAIVRWLGYWLSGILFLGFLWILLDNKRQGFHDKLARTMVVYSQPRAAGVAAATPIRDRLSTLGQEIGAESDEPAQDRIAIT